MATSGVPGLPTPSDANDLQLRVNELEQRLNELPASLMQSVSTLVGQRTLQTEVLGIALGGGDPGTWWTAFGQGMFDFTSGIPDAAVNISVVGTYIWRHSLASTAGGTFSGYLRYGSNTPGTYTEIDISGSLASGQANVVRVPFAFRAPNKSDLAEFFVTVYASISGASFNASDSPTSGYTATVTYGLN